MIIDTNKGYKPNDIMDFMSDLVTNQLSNGYKIDFEQECYIRNCSHIEDEIGDPFMVTTNDKVSVLTYIKGDFDDPTQNVVFIMDRMFEAGTIDDDTFKNELERKVAKFKLNHDGTYRLEGISFNL